MRDARFEVCDDNMTRLLFLHARWHCDGTVGDLVPLFWDIFPIDAETGYNDNGKTGVVAQLSVHYLLRLRV